MRVRTVPAVVGGAVGLLGAATAAGLTRQRRAVARDRAQITPRSAATLHAPPTDRERRVQTDDGVALHTEEVGPADAPLAVLMVHGYALSLQSFVLQRKAIHDCFGDRVRIVLYDQRSHGRSGRSPASACTIEQLGRDLYGVLDQLVPAGPVVLVGHSMGGMTIMALAEQHPELFGDRIAAVALINTSSGELRTVTLGLPGLLARLRGPVLRGAARNVALVERGRALGKDLAWVITKRLSFADPDVPPAVVAFCTNLIAGTPVDVVADFYPTLMAHDGREGLRGLARCEVLVIGAEHDVLTPLGHSEALAAALPHARLVVAPGSGHLLMLEHPGMVDRPLLDLVESAYPATAVAAKARTRRAVQR
ncbi:MAG TPA: alpha/beta hydrolase [Jatrophihabitans sp.]|nr:alpha/beta hydrolase [Jatrophihabitans sp.]